MFYNKIYPKFMEETQKQKIKEILEKVEVKGKILDIGSGPGFLEEFLPEAIAVDTDLENLRKVKGLKVLADGNHLPFKKNSFDTIFCIDTVHLLNNISDLTNLIKAAKITGKIIVSTFCNKYNYEEKKKWLKNNISAASPSRAYIEKEFLVKTKTEWDFVLVLKVNP